MNVERKIQRGRMTLLSLFSFFSRRELIPTAWEYCSRLLKSVDIAFFLPLCFLCCFPSRAYYSIATDAFGWNCSTVPSATPWALRLMLGCSGTVPLVSS